MDISELMGQLKEKKSIHIEGNKEAVDGISAYIRENIPMERVGWVIEWTKGYERETVEGNLKFFNQLFRHPEKVRDVLERFNLTEYRKEKTGRLGVREQMLLQLARASMQHAAVYFLEEPLLNLNENDIKKVLSWMEAEALKGTCFVTVNASLRRTLLMPGETYYYENGDYLYVEKDEPDGILSEEDVPVYKIAVKAAETTLLFDPGEIDYIESMNKNNYISVRGDMYNVSKTMDELEKELGSFGFFRCHRSYIVNVQKVEKIERWTKNSYVLVLDSAGAAQVPLSKGRIEQMKQAYGWK